MHPVMTEMLAAEQIREMVARGDAARCVRQARPGRRARQDRPVRPVRPARGARAAGGRQGGRARAERRAAWSQLPGQRSSPSCPAHGRARKTRAARASRGGRAPASRPAAMAEGDVAPQVPDLPLGLDATSPAAGPGCAAGCREGHEPRDAGKGEKEYRFRWRFRTPLGPQAELQAHRLCGVSPRPVFPARTERTSGQEEGLPCPALRTPVLQTPVLRNRCCENRCCKDRHVNAPAARPAESPVPEARGQAPPRRR